MAESTTLPAAAAAVAAAVDVPAQLSILKDSATKEYSLKNYTAAAELYSEATEIQAELNGEMNPINADLLYAYGRCLYHVAVSNSDVLGGKVAGDKEPAKKKRKTNKASKPDVPKTGEEELAENVVGAAVEEKQPESTANKPFFQITGDDEDWSDSERDDDEEEEGVDGQGEAEEEDDDFAIAYEILDVARVLLGRKLEALSQQHEGKGKAKATPPEQSPEGRQIMERLADTHDLQAEISLENERFADAVSDSKASLELKLKLFPTESSLIAEAHYKLSLALEFASVTQLQAEGEPAEGTEQANAQLDEDMRKEAVAHMDSAIASCKLRVEKETQSLSSLSPDQVKEKERSIKDVTEMIGDMEQRLIDLRDPTAAAASDGQNPLGGILGSILGESADAQRARIEEATKTANDLTGLIKHKKKPKTEQPEPKPEPASIANPAAPPNGKRKAEESLVDPEEKASEKKVKLAEDTPAAAV